MVRRGCLQGVEGHPEETGVLMAMLARIEELPEVVGEVAMAMDSVGKT